MRAFILIVALILIVGIGAALLLVTRAEQAGAEAVAERDRAKAMAELTRNTILESRDAQSHGQPEGQAVGLTAGDAELAAENARLREESAALREQIEGLKAAIAEARAAREGR